MEVYIAFRLLPSDLTEGAGLCNDPLFLTLNSWLIASSFGIDGEIKQQLAGTGIVGNLMIHKKEIVISDYICAGTLAATGGELSMEMKWSLGSKSKPSAYSAGQRPSREVS